jgi:TRAP-type C4-dicarboxylate transport system permease small subunit
MAFLLTAAIWQIYSRIRWKSEPLTAEQISVWCFVFVPVWLSLMVTVPLALK